MKKRILAVFMILSMLSTSLIAVNAQAIEDDAAEVIYFDDGSYLQISAVRTVETQSNTRATLTTVGEKDMTFVNGDGEVEWTYTLTGYFTYTPGLTSACVDAAYTSDIYDSAWSFSNGSAVTSGNTAYGYGSYVKKILFVTIDQYDINISISCDTYGNLS